VKAIFFDAVGTLLFPAVPVAQTYAEVGRRFGSRLSISDIEPGFRAAFVREDLMDRQMEWRTDERREFRRWRDIVTATLNDAQTPFRCFEELYKHYGRPQAWRLATHTGAVLGELASRGLLIGMASNYDQRLRTVAAGFEELVPVRRLVISSEVGYRKPAPAFFEAVGKAAGCGPADIVHVGDDMANDYDAAEAAGLHAVLVGAADGPSRRRVVPDLRSVLSLT
jgi:putative hydrolase of the HAD superfamily